MGGADFLLDSKDVRATFDQQGKGKEFNLPPLEEQ
jgi:hypothetical protein